MNTFTDAEPFVSREEFESTKEDMERMRKELRSWQNTTINILKKYLLDDPCDGKTDPSSITIGSHSNPAPSCTAITWDPTNPSGYYWITNTTGLPIRVYCDVTSTGGWMRVAYLDMTDS